jgi:ABC-type transporter Mla MlaB component
MLRITLLLEPNAGPTLKLEGKLLGPWVDELRHACLEHAINSAQVRLDLSSVTFVDSGGANLLRELIRQGVSIVGCSGYVAELLLPELLHGKPLPREKR